MADLSWTSSATVAGASVNTVTHVAAVAIAAGEFYTLNTSGQAVLADNDSASLDGSAGIYLAINSAAANQRITGATPGQDITVSSTMTVGIFYYLSSNPGKICPVGDLASTDYVTQLGWAKSATLFRFSPVVTGYQVP